MKQTIILLYGGRSAEREVSVLSAESVMRAVNYDRFMVKTFFISQSGDFIKTQEFTQTPSQDDRLMTRLMDSEVSEVIVATNATADGEATSMYLSRLLKPAGIKVTRLARGLAVGADIEYADEVTLLRAIENRTEL